MAIVSMENINAADVDTLKTFSMIMQFGKKKINCLHTETVIVVLNAFAMVEVIGHKCEACGEIVKIIKKIKS